jgi:hypothetical protein
LPRQVLPRHRSLVKTVRDPPSTTRGANSVLCLANGQLVGRRTVSGFYNNRVCARLDSSCVPDSVRASVACSNNLRPATPFISSLPTASFVSRGSNAFHDSPIVASLVTVNGNKKGDDIPSHYSTVASPVPLGTL